jgi:collagenase-like PrtC family protease
MKNIDLVAPAGSLLALKAAVDKGADAVYLGLRNATNARNFGGLNFSEPDIRLGVEYAHTRHRQVLFAINTYPQARQAQEWRAAVDSAVALGADAIILADPGLMAYARNRYPDVRLHLSVQSSATTLDAIELMREQFGIRRAVLPRVLTLVEIEKIIRQTSVEIEVFGFGSLCVMAEGRCLLSSYVTGDSPNNKGVCSPAHAVS